MLKCSCQKNGIPDYTEEDLGNVGLFRPYSTEMIKDINRGEKEWDKKQKFFQQRLKKHDTSLVSGAASGYAGGDGGYACGQLRRGSGGVRGVFSQSV